MNYEQRQAIRNQQKTLWGWLSIISCLVFIACLAVVGYRSAQYDWHCSEYLKRAGDASDARTAEQNLSSALAYIESHGLTNGYTSVVFRSPADDVGYWYRNLVNARSELRRLPSNATQLEASNVLIRTREVLLDHKQRGPSVTEPSGISLHPYNRPMFVWGWLSFLLAAAACLKRYFMH